MKPSEDFVAGFGALASTPTFFGRFVGVDADAPMGVAGSGSI
jgi:hypothetical protein